MRSVTRTLARSQGFTIIEVLVAMTVLLVGVFGAVALLDRANATTVTTSNREAATNLARELVEAARGIPYDELSVPIETKLQGVGGLADDRPGEVGWQIERRGRVFRVTANVCTMDDVSDGYGDQTLSGGFCRVTSPSNPADKNPEDYKRVTVRAAWTQGSVARNVTQTVLINNPGSAGGPAITSLTATNFNVAQVFSASAPQVLTLRATTSSIPRTVSWRVDGVIQSDPMVRADSVGYQWDINWAIGAPGQPGAVPDGPYLVGAEAFNVYGVSGPTRSVTVTLNRMAPASPSGIAGGRSGDPSDLSSQRVDLEWLANVERDIIGYAVFRSTSPTIGSDGKLDGAVEVCALADQLSCADTSPPTTSDPLYYVVRAYDRDPATNSPRPNATDHTPLRVVPNERRPNAPLNLIAVRQSDGTTLLTWERPPAADPAYAGDGIDFYRVYRDSQAFAGRYTRIDDPGATISFVDTQTEGDTHRYWVTAIDDLYGESDFSAEASG